MQVRNTSGDKELDKLIENGTVKDFHTCCNNNVYGDHNLHITMNNNIVINNVSTFIAKSITLEENGVTYSQELNPAVGVASFMSTFFGMRAEVNPTEKKYTHKKMTSNDASTVKEITKDEFDVVFNKLPDAVKNVLTHRMTKNVGAQQVMIVMKNDNDNNEQNANNESTGPNFAAKPSI